MGLLNVDLEFGQVKRLGQVIVGAALHRLDGALHAAVRRQQKNLELGLALF